MGKIKPLIKTHYPVGTSTATYTAASSRLGLNRMGLSFLKISTKLYNYYWKAPFFPLPIEYVVFLTRKMCTSQAFKNLKIYIES